MNRTHAQTLILGLLALAGTASAQTVTGQPDDGGPLVVGTPRESWRRFQLQRLDAALEFRGEYQHDKLEVTGQPSQTTTQWRLRELLDVSGQAFVGHRNLLDITAAAQLGLEDIDTSSNIPGLDTSETDFVAIYDINALLLASSKLPTNFYARREENQLDRAFAGSIDETISEAGFSARYQSERAPTSLTYFHREDQLKGDFGQIDSKTNQDSINFTNAIFITPRQRLETTYTFDRIDERQQGGYSDSYDRNDLNVVHTATFGEENRPHELRSSFRLYDQTGRQEQSRINWDELLTLRHSERLESRYNIVAEDLEVRGQDQQLLRGEASIKHRLFDSLTSVATVGAQRYEAPGSFTSDGAFINGQLDYTKKVPLGRLDASAGGGFNAQRNSDRGSTVSVIDEPYTFVDGFAIIIARRNIVPGSIVITPTSGFPVYQEGLDYTVQYFPDRAEVRGVVGGAWVNGQRLNISYDLGPEPGNDVDTTALTFSIRYTLTEGWLRGTAFYGTYRNVRQSISAADPSLFRPDDLDDLLLGVEHQFSNLTVLYEYNIHDSTFDPYTLHRIQAIYSLPLGPASALNAEFTREMINYSDDGDDVNFDRGSLRWVSRLGRDLDFNVGLEYRNEDSSLSGDSTGFEQTVGLTWTKRQTTIFASFRNSMLDGSASNETSQYLQFGFRRTF